MASAFEFFRGRRLLPALFLVAVAVFGSLSLLLAARDSRFAQYYNNRWRGRLEYFGNTGSKSSGSSSSSTTTATAGVDFKGPPLPRHPIDDLIRDARTSFNQLLGRRSLTLEQAAARYRERRGRHPPPGFDKWFAVALEKNAVVVEEFFDRIHHDLNPFWGLEPHEIRARAHAQPFTVRVRNGTVDFVTDDEGEHFRLRQFRLLVQDMPWLPDLDMYINHMDESRVMVPWENVSHYVAIEERERTLVSPYDAIGTYGGVTDVENNTRYDPDWQHGDSHKFWDFTRDACPPGSPGRSVSALPSLDAPIDFPTTPVPAYTRHGYVHNFTASMDPCLQPHLRGMHGTFIEAISMSTTRQLVPIFGECKLTTNNEILLPAAVYIAEDERADYSGGGERGGPWADKKPGAVWRGAASGLRNKADNWWHNHRHRFVQMLNATTLRALEAGGDDATAAAPTFRLPPLTITTTAANNTNITATTPNPYYTTPAQREHRLGDWVSTWADAGFTTMACHPSEQGPDGKDLKTCRHTDHLMALVEGFPFSHAYNWKYLPDIDGNSFSGRYRAFLQSSSLPLKATIYAEWHDARLFPWVHFVPLDNAYLDVYGVMDYFVGRGAGGGGGGRGGGHDAEAERMAKEGQEWATAVLRREDMMLYTWRLLLEYARVMDDNRHRLAYVDDLMKR